MFNLEYVLQFFKEENTVFKALKPLILFWFITYYAHLFKVLNLNEFILFFQDI